LGTQRSISNSLEDHQQHERERVLHLEQIRIHQSRVDNIELLWVFGQGQMKKGGQISFAIFYPATDNSSMGRPLQV
jgi:hypothetical protein